MPRTVSRSPLTHDCSWYGPVPTGASLPYVLALKSGDSPVPPISLALPSSIARGLPIENAGRVSADRKLADGVLSVIFACVASTASHEEYRLGGASGSSLFAKPPNTVVQ